LPYRVQAYYEAGQLKLAYTDVQFLKLRHGLEDSPVLAEVEKEIAGNNLKTGTDTIAIRSRVN